MPDARTVIFRESREHVRHALRRMLDKPEEQGPFVIVELAPRTGPDAGPYVQFAGSDARPLVFDAPMLRQRLLCTLEGGLNMAEEGLTRLGVGPEDKVLITEDDTHKPRRRGRSIRDLFRSLGEALW